MWKAPVLIGDLLGAGKRHLAHVIGHCADRVKQSEPTVSKPLRNWVWRKESLKKESNS